MMLTNLRSPANWLLNLFGGGSDSVDAKSMNAMPAVWYCLQKIAGDIGKTPLEPRKTKADGRGSEPYTQHETWQLLRNRPNRYQTCDVFKELIQLHALTYGNGRAWIRRNGVKPAELIPLLPDRTDTVMVGGEKYHITEPDEHDPIKFQGTMNGFYREGELPKSAIVMPDVDVLHIIGMGFDGVKGWNIGKVFEDVLSAGRASHRLVRKQAQKGFTGKVMITDAGGAFSGQNAETQAKAFINDMRKHYTAEQEGEIVGMLRRGMTAEVLTMSNADAQLIEQMRFNRQDVQLIFGVQHIPGEQTTYANLEQKRLDTLESTNDRWMVRWENECDAKFRTEAEERAGQMYYKFNAGARLRTDVQTSANVLSTLTRSMLITRNEAREKLEMNPVEGGDEFINPAIQVQESLPNDTNQDRARNTLQRLSEVEAKRVLEIVSKKNIAESDAAITSFYDKFKITLNREMSDLDSSFDVDWHVDKRMEEIATIAACAKSLQSFRESVRQAVLKWSE